MSYFEMSTGPKVDAIDNVGSLEVVPGDFFGTGRPLKKKTMFLHDHSWDLINSD